MTKIKKRIIGVMSGTSLDGLDLAACEFEQVNGQWTYRMIHAQTTEYSDMERKKLAGLMTATAEELAKADFDFGYYIGDQVKKFIDTNNLEIDAIASHGHTVFHQPDRGFTLQIGRGAAIASRTDRPVVYDFRSLDVCLGGQGAPLVPIGDKLLYSSYKYCLNLGGIANISFDDSAGNRIAFDVCPVNLVLNHLAREAGKEFDEDGNLGRSGKLILPLFNHLEGLDFYKQKRPKSLGKESVDKEVIAFIEQSKESTEDKIHTFCHHIASRIAAEIGSEGGKLLVTGGGALNNFLIQLLNEKLSGRVEVVVPDLQTVLFKEAIVFAFLGFLRINELTNCLATVTGSSRDSSSGSIVGVN